MINDDLERYADASQEQYFLVSPAKLAQLMHAAEIRPSDAVVEVGAGVGTVAAWVPECRTLTVVELDERLVELLRENVPRARVVQGDALELVQQIPCDVLLSNLPTVVTEALIRDVLPRLSFRTAVLAVGQATDLASLGPGYSCSEVATITGEDFRPPQPSISRLVRVSRRVDVGNGR